MTSHLPLVVWIRAHLAKAAKRVQNPVGAAPLDPQHHQPAHRNVAHILGQNDGVTDDHTLGPQPVEAGSDRHAGQPDDPGKIRDRDPRVPPEFGDDPGVFFVHSQNLCSQYDNFTCNLASFGQFRQTKSVGIVWQDITKRTRDMDNRHCILVGAPVDSGKRRRGCNMGPDAYRAVGLAETLADLGHKVTDMGNVAPAPRREGLEGNDRLYALPETVAWTEALTEAAESACKQGFPVFLGGDHALSLGTVAGVAKHAHAQGRELFVLWLDAHTDLHTPATTGSGNLHGTPLGYISGSDGFGAFPPMPHPVPPAHIGLIGLRSVDRAERDFLADSEMLAADMRSIDEQGIAKPLESFLNRVREKNGVLHVSLDVDFLEPAIAPAVGTTVPGGATYREAHLVMETLWRQRSRHLARSGGVEPDPG